MSRRAFESGFDFLSQLLTVGIAVSPALVYEALAGWMSQEEAGPGDADLRLVVTQLEAAPQEEAWDNASMLSSSLERLVPLLGRSDTFLRLRQPLSSLNYIAAAVLAYNQYLAPTGAPAQVPEPLFALCSLALGLLVLQRMNAANERYSRARGLWADVASAIRNLSRQAHLWAGREEFLNFSRWLPALPAAMLCQVRRLQQPELAQMLRASRGSRAVQVAESKGLSELEIDEVTQRPNGMSAPRYVFLKIMALSSELDVPELQKPTLESELSRLSRALNACERTSEEVVHTYSKQTARLLFLWLALLPFALPSQLGVGVVLSHQLIAFGLLGIEDVGIQLEEPFKVLPLEGPCAKLATECQALRVSWRRMRRGSSEGEIKRAPSYSNNQKPKPGSDQEVIRL